MIWLGGGVILTEISFLFVLSPLLVVGLLYMQRVGSDRAGAFWGVAWLCLWLNALIVAGVPDPYEALRGIGNVLGSAFAALMLCGALAFTGRSVRFGILGLGLALGLVSGSLRATGLVEEAFLVSRLEALFLVAAAVVLWRSASQASEPKRLLAVFALGFAALLVGERTLVSWGLQGFDTLAVWSGLSFGAGLAQVFCFLEQRRGVEHGLRRKLEADRRTLAELVENMPAGVLLVGSDGRVALQNREMTKALELPPGTSLIGMNVEDLGDASAKLLAPSERAAAVAAVREIGWMPDARREVELRIPGPPERWVAVSASEIEGREGDKLGRVWVVRDRTEAKQLTAQLASAQRIEALAGLVGGIAHDFNNELTTILGNVEVLLDSVRQEDPGWEELQAVHSAAEHSAAMTRGLLDFARQSAGPRRALSVAAELAEATALLRLELSDGIRLETQLGPDLPSLLADATQFRRVIANLVTNAAGALGDAGHIRIEADRGRSSNGAPAVTLRVRDDGPGMDAATQQRIFEPFFTTRGESGGTGLGLAIVWGIAGSHGASIEVDTAPSCGTCVCLTWPGTEEPPSPRPNAFSRSGGREGDGRIVLLVGEDEAVRGMVRRALNERGYRVIEACDGESAIELLRKREGDVAAAVLDLDMPGRDGIETLRELRKLRPSLSAVLATGWITPEQRSELPRHVSVLEKPFAPDQLVRAVGETMGAAPRPA